MENMDKVKAVADKLCIVIGTRMLAFTRDPHDELLLEEIAKRWNTYRKFVTFLMAVDKVFDLAICATPTGALRNELTEQNIERMGLINDASAIVLRSEKLDKLLEQLKEADLAMGEVSSDDSRFLDVEATYRKAFRNLTEYIQAL